MFLEGSLTIYACTLSALTRVPHKSMYIFVINTIVRGPPGSHVHPPPPPPPGQSQSGIKMTV